MLGGGQRPHEELDVGDDLGGGQEGAVEDMQRDAQGLEVQPLQLRDHTGGVWADEDRVQHIQHEEGTQDGGVGGLRQDGALLERRQDKVHVVRQGGRVEPTKPDASAVEVWLHGHGHQTLEDRGQLVSVELRQEEACRRAQGFAPVAHPVDDLSFG